MRRKLFTFFLALVAGVGTMFASDTSVDGIWYNFNDDDLTAEVTYQGDDSDSNFDRYSGEVVIPSSVIYNSVTYSVTSIGQYAFSGCGSLTSIEIPYCVTSIGGGAFFNCGSLTSIEIPYSVTSIGTQAFYYCTGLTSVTIPNSVTSIGNQAFYYCSSLTSVTIPNSVTSIGEEAFYGCSRLTSVTIPNSVTSIGERAFSYCSGLTSVSVEVDNTIYDSRDNCNAIIETASNTLVAGCKNTIIPNSVTSIGDGAFAGCRSLTSVTIPNSVTSIGNDAFYYCTGLTSVTIPNSVTSIGNQAFYGCSGLTSVTCEAVNPPALGNAVFDQVDKSIPLYVPAESITAYQTAADWNEFTNIQAIPSSGGDTPLLTEKVQIGDLYYNLNTTDQTAEVTSQNGEYPYWSTTITTADIPASVTYNDTVYSVTSIGEYAFSDCIGLTSVAIPNSVTSIGNWAFSGCSGLTSVTIPSSVISIGEYAFSWCSNLTSVTIPNSVTSIGYNAFRDCSSLTSVTCEAVNPPATDNFAFNQVDKSIPLYVPAEGIAAYQAATGWNEFTNIQAIKSSGGDTPIFPDDPGTLTYNLELHAAVVGGDTIAGQAPAGAGGYPAGTEVKITARDIPGYEFVQWSDSVTDMTRTIVVNESMTLTALYNHSMIEIPVAANQWNFICLPPLGDRQYTEDLFTYDGLTDVKWGIYNGNRRAEERSGWETPETFNAMQGYILYSTTEGTLKINAYIDDIRQGDSDTISAPLRAYASSHTENANWNFLGNPYSQGFNISAFAGAGIESPITVWNGTGYTTYTPGIDDYTLRPFEAFFIQKPEGAGAPEAITFIR